MGIRIVNPEPAYSDLPGTQITSIGQSGSGPVLLNTAQTATTSATWPAANRILYIPVVVEEGASIFQFWTYNGSTAAGSIDVGIFNSSLAKVISSGAVSQSGTSTLQLFDVADTPITPGLYYLGLSETDNTSTFLRSSANFVALAAEGVLQEGGSGTLPATATPVAPASSYLPLFGASLVSVI
jgi:hypothetical protein